MGAMAYMELPIDDDDTIQVEITDQGMVRAGAGDLAGKASERLDEAVAKVVKMGQQIIKQARETPRPPDAIDVELGLKLTAKTNFVVAGSTGEANFKVTLKWTLDHS
jgi:hypothetical protein